MPYSTAYELRQFIANAYQELKNANIIESFMPENKELRQEASARRSEIILDVTKKLINAENPEIFYDTMSKLGIKNISFSDLEKAYKSSAEGSPTDNEWKKIKARLALPLIKKIIKKAGLSVAV